MNRPRLPIILIYYLLKKIKMMNKRRTSEIGKAKYLLFAPLAGVLLMVSNIESVAREIGEQIPEVAEVQQKAEQAAEEKVKTKPQTDTTKKKKTWDCMPETMPYFPGGQELMQKYLADNIKYPASAVKAKKQGRVIVTFIVQKDGSITHAKIVRSIDSELDAEALRVVKGMPKWTPGTQFGKPVSVKYTLPVKFSLQKDATPGKKK
jgi:TonB family protein